MGDVRFLLISDLHMMENYDWKLMKRGLENFLDENQVKFVILLGDFHNYSEANYSKAEKFIRDIANKNNLSLSKDFFLVPGNHDVEELSNLEDYFKKLKNEKFANCEDIYQELNKRFSRYNDFVCKLLSKNDSYNPAEVHLRKWNNINIVHLNTAIVSDGNREHKEFLNIEKLASIEVDDNPTIMIGHHSLNDIDEELVSRINDFARENNVLVYYCGDRHKVGFRIHPLNAHFSKDNMLPEIGAYKADADSKDLYSDCGIILGTIKDGKSITNEGFLWETGSGFIHDARVCSDEIIKRTSTEEKDSSRKTDLDCVDTPHGEIFNWGYKYIVTLAIALVVIMLGTQNVSKWISDKINIEVHEEKNDSSNSSKLSVEYSEQDEEKRSGESTASLESIANDVTEVSESNEVVEELVTYKWDDEAQLFNIDDYNDLSVDELFSKVDSIFIIQIIDKKKDVNIEKEMSDDYANFVLSANTIYDNVDDNDDYADICENILNAADCRDNAKEEYRQASNEQIEGNYYSRCASDANSNGYIDEEFRFYQKAIEYYVDAYSVALARGNERASALEYMATCYYRIGEIQNLEKSIRTEAYISAICVWHEYLEKTDEKKLTTDLSIARSYFRLFRLSEDMEAKFSYFLHAKSSYEDCLDNGQCKTKTTPVVLEELRFLCQCCIEDIEENFYTDDLTKEDVEEWRDDYNKRLKPYKKDVSL